MGEIVADLNDDGNGPVKSLPRHPGVGSSTQVCRRRVCMSSSVIVVGGMVRDGGGPCTGSVGSVGGVGNGCPWGFCQFQSVVHVAGCKIITSG